MFDFVQHEKSSFFIFIFFNFVFYKNIFLFSKFTGIYPGRPAAGRLGHFCETCRRKFAPESLEDRSSGSGAAGPQAARQWGGGSWPPACRVTGSPTLI